MGYLRVNITNIVSPNPFKVSFKSVVGDDSAYGGFTVTTGYTYYHNGTDYSSYNTCPTYPAGTTSVEISSNGLDFNSNCWVKIEDTVTKTLLSDGTEIPRYIIENIYLHDPIAYQSCCPQPEALTAVCYHDCYPPFSLTAVCVSDITPTPTPTPTNTPTSTPTPTPTVGTCTVPTLDRVSLVSDSLFTYNYNAPDSNCQALTLSYSRDQITWTNSTGGCVTERQRDTGDATGTWYFRLTQICKDGGSTNSNVVDFTFSEPTPTPTPTPIPQPSVNMASNPICRSGNCNDNAQCTVYFPVYVYNAPDGYYVTYTPSVSSSATVTYTSGGLYSQGQGYVTYTETNGFGNTSGDLKLYNGGGTLLDTTTINISHSSFWPTIGSCS